MSADAYLGGILHRETVSVSAAAAPALVLTTLRPVIARWAGAYLVGMQPSGSYAKGTAIRSGPCGKT